MAVRIAPGQTTTGSLAPAETDVFTVGLGALRQYRIDIHGTHTNQGTLATAALAEIVRTGARDQASSFIPDWYFVLGALQADAQPSGTLYFTPLTTGDHDIQVRSAGIGSYAITVHEPGREQVGLSTRGTELGTTFRGTPADDLIALDGFGLGFSATQAPRPRSGLDGGGGFDTVVVDRHWTAAVVGGQVLLSAEYNPMVGLTSTPKGIDAVWGDVVLTGIEVLQTPTRLIYMLGGDRAHVPRLYQAALDRAPDVDGVAYHLARHEGGTSLRDIASAFMASPEFQGRYGALDSPQFIRQLYRNVLDREGEAAGLAFYEDQLASGAMDREAVLIGFAASPENQLRTGSFIFGMG